MENGKDYDCILKEYIESARDIWNDAWGDFADYENYVNQRHDDYIEMLKCIE